MSKDIYSTPLSNIEVDDEETSGQVDIKRPWGVYLVAFWAFFGLSIMLIGPFTKVLLPSLDLTAQQFTLGKQGSTLFLLYLTCGVILLNKPATYILTGVFSLLSIFQVYSIIAFLISGDFESRIIGSKLILVALTSVCIWYLMRQKFRIHSNKYRESKVRDKNKNRKLKEFNSIQKHVSKQLSKTLK